MAPVTVNMITKADVLKEITIEISESATVQEIKSKIWAKTNLPTEFMEILVSGLSKLHCVDRRHMNVGYCGSSNCFSFIVGEGAKATKA